MIEPTVSRNRFGREVQKFDPTRVLLLCAAVSNEMDSRKVTQWSVDFPPRMVGSILVPQRALAGCGKRLFCNALVTGVR